jgi:hypothetical protein
MIAHTLYTWFILSADVALWSLYTSSQGLSSRSPPTCFVRHAHTLFYCNIVALHNIQIKEDSLLNTRRRENRISHMKNSYYLIPEHILLMMPLCGSVCRYEQLFTQIKNVKSRTH